MFCFKFLKLEMKRNFTYQNLSSNLSFTDHQHLVLKDLWILPQVVLAILSIFVICIMISFNNYKKMKMRQMAARNDKKLKLLWAIFKILLCLVLLKFLASTGLLLVGIFYSKNEVICEIYIDTLFTLRGFCCAFGFNFLWLRNYIVYKSPMLKHLYTPIVKLIAWFTVILFNILVVFSFFLAYLADIYSMTEYGCITRRKQPIAAYIGYSLIFVCLTLLFGLFLHPLRAKLKVEKVSNKSQRQNKNSVLSHKLKNTVRISTVTSFIMFTSFLFCWIFTEFCFSMTTPKIYTVMMYDITLFINVYSVLYTFLDYKFRLLKDFKDIVNSENKQISNYKTSQA